MPLAIKISDQQNLRRRGDCQACCKLLPMPRYGKAAGERCQHQRAGKGCAIYKDRPSECQVWNCRWLGDPAATANLSTPHDAPKTKGRLWDSSRCCPYSGKLFRSLLNVRVETVTITRRMFEKIGNERLGAQQIANEVHIVIGARLFALSMPCAGNRACPFYGEHRQHQRCTQFAFGKLAQRRFRRPADFVINNKLHRPGVGPHWLLIAWVLRFVPILAVKNHLTTKALTDFVANHRVALLGTAIEAVIDDLFQAATADRHTWLTTEPHFESVQPQHCLLLAEHSRIDFMNLFFANFLLCLVSDHDVAPILPRQNGAAGRQYILSAPWKQGLATRLFAGYSFGMDRHRLVRGEVRDGALIRVIEAVGGVRRLEALLDGNVSHQAISQWRRVPADRLVDIEKATGIPRHEIWPELYEGYVRRKKA